jgi:hypothetical protein
MFYLELKGGIDTHPELDIFVRRLALLAALIAVVSVISAVRNPKKSAWVVTATVIGCVSLSLGIITVLFAAP